MNLAQYVSQSLFGRPSARQQRRIADAHARGGLARLEQAMTRYQPTRPADDASPLFILSAGWRSGSTLLQRLVCSNPEHKILIWGEPYDLCNLVQRMTESLLPVDQDWPPQGYFITAQVGVELDKHWIANLYPPLDALWVAHRNFFETLFAKPAGDRGYPAWGLKEVRLGIEHARYLQWLYPRARFLLLCRNPVDAYASYAQKDQLWFDRWPSKPMLTARQFGRHWRELVTGFMDADLSGRSLLLKYEDLTADNFDFDALERFVGYSLDRAVLANRIGGSDGRRPVWLSKLDKYLIRHATAPTAKRLGYS